MAIATGLGIVNLLGEDGPNPDAEDIIRGIEHSWQNIAVFAGGLILGSATELNASPDLGKDSRIEWPRDGQALGIRRPVMVAHSAGLNGFNSKEIDPNVLGFWLPDSANEPVFARYDRNGAFWPVYRGRYSGYSDDLRQMRGEAVKLEMNGSGPRHFIIHRPEYKEKESRTRRKDVGQSALVDPIHAKPFIIDLHETSGGFEIRDWETRQGRQEEYDKDSAVDPGKFEGSQALSQELVDEVKQGLEEEWDQVNVFGGVVGVNKTSKVYSDPRLAEDTEIEWPEDYPHAVVVRPLFVVGSSRMHKDGVDLDKIEKSIKRTTVGFFLPGPNRFVYMDTAANAGNIVPMSRGFYPQQLKTDGILGFDVSLDGRENKGGVSYPYFEEEYQELIKEGGYNEDYSVFTPPEYELQTRKVLVGHSLGFSNGADAAAVIYDFYADKWTQPLLLDN